MYIVTKVRAHQKAGVERFHRVFEPVRGYETFGMWR